METKLNQIIHKQNYQAHLHNLSKIHSLTCNIPQAPLKRELKASKSEELDLDYHHHFVQKKLQKSKSSDLKQFKLPRIYNQIKERISDSRVSIKLKQDRQIKDQNIKLLSRMIQCNRKSIFGKKIQSKAKRKFKITKATVAKVILRQTKLLPLNNLFFEIKLKIKNLEYNWPLIDQFQIRLGVCIQGVTAGKKPYKLKHSRQELLDSVVMTQFKATQKIQQKKSNSTQILSQIMQVQSLINDIFVFKGGYVDVQRKQIPILYFMLIGVKKSSEFKMFFFSIQGQSQKQTNLIDPKGKKIGLIRFQSQLAIKSKKSSKEVIDSSLILQQQQNQEEKTV